VLPYAADLDRAVQPSRAQLVSAIQRVLNDGGSHAR
jgi:hypothetical protein